MAPTPDPATAASGLLREFEERFGVPDAPPIPVERIATSYLDLDIDEHDDIRALPGAPQDQGHLSGMLDPEQMIIWLDRGESAAHPRRRRFTIAHEMGHWRMHVPKLRGPIFEARGNIYEDEPEPSAVPELRRREAEANAFARELLMPETLIRRHVEETGCNLPALVERFDVSMSAMRLRVMTLGLMPAWMTQR